MTSSGITNLVQPEDEDDEDSEVILKKADEIESLQVKNCFLFWLD